MRLLGDLTDVEVIWLRAYAVPTIGGDDEFRKLHEDVFQRKLASISSSIEEVEAKALQESYRNHLIQLGLVKGHISKNRDGVPEFDRFTGDFKITYHRTTTLGNLLLRQIDLSPEGGI